jgi:hypothetical protein
MEKDQAFAVIAESKNYEKPLYLYNLPFPRLIDDVVVPYQSDKSFFIDGVPLTAKDLKRIKIVRQNASFASNFEELHSDLQLPKLSGRRVPAEDYEIRLQAIFRDAGDDVTSQVIAAYQARIRDKLKEYVPNKKELIDAALQVFIQSISYLGKSGS